MGILNGLVTEHDFAKQMGVMVGTVRGWRKRRYGPPSAKLGKLVVYRTQDVEAFVASLFAAKDD